MHTSAYLCKLYPSKSEEAILNQILDTSTEVYNFYVDRMVEKATTGDKKNYGAYTWKKILTQEKKDLHPEWNSVNRSILSNTLFAIEDSIQTTLTKRHRANFIRNEKEKKKFSEAQFPHKKKRLSWFKMDNGYEIKNNQFILKKTGTGRHKDGNILCSIQFRGLKNIPNAVICPEVIVTRKNNTWFIVIIYKYEDNLFHVNQDNDSLGLDWGIITPLSKDNGEKIDFNTEQFRLPREDKHYKELQCKLRQQKRGSHRSEKTKLAMRKIRQREKNRKTDFYFKLALSLVLSYKIICIEDLDLGKLQSRKFRHGRKMNLQSISLFFQILEWMSRKYGSLLIKVNPKHTSKTCCRCGYLKKDLTQKDRNWICPQCKTEHDRDQNAAVNIKNLGLYTLRIRESEREVKDRTSIQDYFQAIGIKR